MQDEKRPCSQCGHDHAYGILRYSPDGVPFYSARHCWCHCDHFVERNMGVERKFIDHQGEHLPDTFSLPDKELKELWADTSFLNAQVPMATRIAVRQIHGLLEAANLAPMLTTALTELTGLVVSQVTDIRGALTRGDNKFAHLVAHTDEIVEAMRGVTQLAERLNTIYGAISQIQQQQAKTEHDIVGIAAVLQKLAPDSVKITRTVDICTRPICGHLKADHADGVMESGKDMPVSFCRVGSYELGTPCECPGYLDSSPKATFSRESCSMAEWVPYGPEAPHVFVEKIGPLKDEPIVTSVDPDHD